LLEGIEWQGEKAMTAEHLLHHVERIKKIIEWTAFAVASREAAETVRYVAGLLWRILRAL
jgi:hypothetical protein